MDSSILNGGQGDGGSQALLGWLRPNARTRIPFMGVPYVFCLLNWATAVAFLRFITGHQRVTWEKAVKA